VRNAEASLELSGRILYIKFGADMMLPESVRVKDSRGGMEGFLQEVNDKLNRRVYEEFFEALNWVAKKFVKVCNEGDTDMAEDGG
jgi:hypothetical protein